MLVIRLARTGKKKQAYFRIVVAEKQRAVSAKFIEILGNYNPHEKKLELDQERLEKYLGDGAQPSNTLAKILKKEGVKLPKWVFIVDKNKPAKKTEEPSEESPKSAEAASKEDKVAESVENTSDKEENIPVADAQDAGKPEEEASSEPVEEDTKE